MKKKIGINVVVLAAGKGTRMNSFFPKVCQKIAGRALLEHVLNFINNVDNDKYDKNIIIVFSEDVMKNYVGNLPKQANLNYIIQEKQLGTGHAVLTAKKSKYWNSDNKLTGVFYADVPFITEETISKMFDLQRNFDLTVLGFDCKDQTRPYGRLFTSKDLRSGEYGKLFQIKEFKDLMREKPRLCNSGLMIGKTKIFDKFLRLIKTKNKAKEYYLTDIVSLANKKYNVGAYICDEYEVIGINSRAELAHAENEYQKRLQDFHMKNGATLLNANSIYFSYDTKIGKDVIIEPNVFFGLGVVVGDNCIIKAGSYLENVMLKNFSVVNPHSCFLNDKKIKKNKN